MSKIRNPVDPKIIEAEEHLLIDCQILLQEMISSKNMTCSALAERARISKARLSQLMRPEANPTVKTMARLFHALDEELVVSTKKKEGYGSALIPERRTEGEHWNWTQTPNATAKDDARFVAVLKEASKGAAVSNDNHSPVVVMESDVMTALEAA